MRNEEDIIVAVVDILYAVRNEEDSVVAVVEREPHNMWVVLHLPIEIDDSHALINSNFGLLWVVDKRKF